MSRSRRSHQLRQAILKRLTLLKWNMHSSGHDIRRRIFGTRSVSTPDKKGSSLLKKVHAQRLLQRHRAFQRAGGRRSSVALHGLIRARLRKKS